MAVENEYALLKELVENEQNSEIVHLLRGLLLNAHLTSQDISGNLRIDVSDEELPKIAGLLRNTDENASLNIATHLQYPVILKGFEDALVSMNTRDIQKHFKLLCLLINDPQRQIKLFTTVLEKVYQQQLKHMLTSKASFNRDFNNTLKNRLSSIVDPKEQMEAYLQALKEELNKGTNATV